MPALLLVLVLLLAGCVPGRAAPVGAPTADAPFTLTALDVGQGDALLLRAPGAVVLVDTGEPDADVVRLLRREGVDRLDLLVVTHAHLDHVGGAPSILEAMPVAVVWMHPIPADATVVEQHAATLRIAERRGIPVRGPPAGAVVAVGDLVLEVLGPPPGRPYAGARSEINNNSIVLRASVAGAGSVLLAGDIERESQADLLATYPERLRVDVLVVPHHGSRTTDPAFLAGTGAHTAVISVGGGNRHGHPARDTLDALSALGMTVVRTDLSGTIRIVLQAEGGARRGAPVGAPVGAGARG
jgi:competence protein ComEC